MMWWLIQISDHFFWLLNQSIYNQSQFFVSKSNYLPPRTAILWQMLTYLLVLHNPRNANKVNICSIYK